MDNSILNYDSNKKSKYNRYALGIFIFIIVSFSIYQFFPIIYVNEDINFINEKIKQIEIDDNFKEVLRRGNFEKNYTKADELANFNIAQKSFNIEKTSFVEYSYTIIPYIYLNNAKVSPDLRSLNGPFKYELLGNIKDPKIVIRYDNMLISYPILFITLFVLYVNNLTFLKDTKELDQEIDGDNQEAKLNSLEANFNKNIDYSEKIMLELNNRSVYLLSFGILMSFIGMGVFYVTLPQNVNSVNDINSFILSIIKPLFILLFIEAIAWFLLKQYRNLMEDFKYFYKIYLKRNNYKLSYYLLKEMDNKTKYEILINSLLSEDLSGKIYSGETTESLENKKIKDLNTKEALQQQLLELLKKQKES